MPSPRHRELAPLGPAYAPVTGISNRSKGTNGTPSWVCNNTVSDEHSISPSGQHTLAFYTRYLMPEELQVLSFGIS